MCIQQQKPALATDDGAAEALDSASAEHAQPFLNPALMWPKDRSVFLRLEKVCHCVEKGEWPSANRFAPRVMDNDSGATTPGGLTTPSSRSDYFVGVSDSMVSCVATAQCKFYCLPVTHVHRVRVLSDTLRC